MPFFNGLHLHFSVVHANTKSQLPDDLSGQLPHIQSTCLIIMRTDRVITLFEALAIGLDFVLAELLVKLYKQSHRIVTS